MASTTITTTTTTTPALDPNFEKGTSIRSLIAQITLSEAPTEIIDLLYTSSTSTTIHPAFALDRWSNLSQRDYIRIAPALVLASRLLTCDISLHYFHALAFAPRNIRPDKNGIRLKRFFRADPTAPLSEKHKSQVDQLFSNITSYITLHEKHLVGCTGQCRPSDRISPFAPGLKSTISIHQNFTKTLTRLLHTPSLASDPSEECLSQLHKQWTTLAVVLVHEFAHAVTFAIFGLLPESCFENDGFKEAGYAWETLLFRGSFDLVHTLSFLGDDDHHQEEAVVVLGWTTDQSHFRGARVLPPRSGLPQRPVGAVAVSSWIVSDVWLAALFESGFWERVSGGGSAALVPEPRFRRDEPELSLGSGNSASEETYHG